VRSVGPNDKWQVGNCAQGLNIHEHAAEWSLKRVDGGGGNPTHVDVVCWPDQHDARDRLRAVPKRRECRGGNAARIGIACMRRNQCFGHDLCGRDIG
jgi:hypothetical protein